jgi:hypothetical protein
MSASSKDAIPLQDAPKSTSADLGVYGPVNLTRHDYQGE